MRRVAPIGGSTFTAEVGTRARTPSPVISSSPVQARTRTGREAELLPS